MVNENFLGESDWKELIVIGMANPLYNKVISMLNENGTNISNFGIDRDTQIYTHVYSLDGHLIRIDYNKEMDKLIIRVKGDNSLGLIKKLNLLDPIPF